MATLVVNQGSTSRKLSLVERSGEHQTVGSLEDAFDHPDRIDAVVHRVVHGGSRVAPAPIDDALIAELERLAELAPLHQRPAIALIDRCRVVLPGVPQYACFDTSFHATVPAAARTYAIPSRWREQVKAYGFHGISHAWSTRQVARVAPGARRLVVAHLGGGASLCAVHDGQSVLCTMGFTPLDGLVMATRSGSIDPGAVLWLMAHTDEDVSHVLEQESGLLGLCGDAEMPAVLRRANDGDDTALLARDVYLHRLVTAIGACTAALGGLDALVFTGGVGAGSAEIRARTVAALAWLGLGIDEHAPSGTVSEITARGAAVRTFVVDAREDLEMVLQIDALG